jgi:hypothetical protein
MMPSKSVLASRPAVAFDRAAFGRAITASPNATDVSATTGEKTVPLMPTAALA